MGLQIYNTRTRQKEPFAPAAAPKVGMYVCGVTVYDLCHIGHARVYVAFDVVARALRHKGFDLTYVRNFTDVDDKIIKRANERGESAVDLASRFIETFHADMSLLGVAPADIEPRVSEHMPQIIELVKTLVDREHAYVVEGTSEGQDVYFAVRSFASYGGLSGRDLDDLQAGARVDVDERKRDPTDFALWKSAKPGEPWWDSPWGKGRPGWHIECSAMGMHYLGHTLDIHGGGKDLVFPHHENEIAQSEAATGQPFVRMWMHNGFVNIDQEKMSKSLGNFFTIREVVERFDPEALRYFLLSTHYRSPLNFSDAVVEEAESRVMYVYETLARLDETLASTPAEPDGEPLSQVFAHDGLPYQPRAEFEAALDDDFNTPRTLSVLAELLRIANALMDGKEKELIGRKLKPAARARLLDAWKLEFEPLQRVLGLGQKDPRPFLDALRERRCRRRDIDPTWVEEQLAQRGEAKASKDFARADQIRTELTDRGVEVRDTRDGTLWRVI
ncbi:MAG: cysteine--tRNA ligase [Pseudomonadota bacterium]